MGEREKEEKTKRLPAFTFRASFSAFSFVFSSFFRFSAFSFFLFSALSSALRLAQLLAAFPLLTKYVLRDVDGTASFFVFDVGADRFGIFFGLIGATLAVKPIFGFDGGRPSSGTLSCEFDFCVYDANL